MNLSLASFLHTLQGGTAYALKTVLDGTDYVLASASKIAQKSDDSLHYLTMSNAGIVKVALHDISGNPIAQAIGMTTPTDFHGGFLEQAGAVLDKTDLRVDGSSTPVSFIMNPDPTYDIYINTITLVIVANALTFGSDKFAGLSALTNGVEVSVTTEGTKKVIFNITKNECFSHMATPGGFDLTITNKDVIRSTFAFNGAAKLEADSSDKLELIIRDDLSGGINYFAACAKGVLGNGA